MVVEMMRFRIQKSHLRNECPDKQIELEINYEYKCGKQDETTKSFQCDLVVQIYDKKHRTQIDQSPFYISTEFIAEFSSSCADIDEVRSESFRLLFPYTQAYIIQLTAGAYLQPLNLPYISLADIKKQGEQKKAVGKSKKVTKV